MNTVKQQDQISLCHDKLDAVHEAGERAAIKFFKPEGVSSDLEGKTEDEELEFLFEVAGSYYNFVAVNSKATQHLPDDNFLGDYFDEFCMGFAGQAAIELDNYRK